MKKHTDYEIGMLEDIIEKQRLAEQLGARNVEFDKVIKYLEFQRLPAHKKAAVYGTRAIGIVFALVLVLVLVLG